MTAVKKFLIKFITSIVIFLFVITSYWSIIIYVEMHYTNRHALEAAIFLPVVLFVLACFFVCLLFEAKKDDEAAAAAADYAREKFVS